MKKTAKWHVPFKGRNHSGFYDQNFLWQQDSVYVMDNHRAAFWCWLQEVNLSSSHSFLHIDRHNDTQLSNLKLWLDNLPELKNISIEDYLSCSHAGTMNGDVPIFNWGNYASIYLELFGSHIDTCRFVTHGDGDKPNHEDVMFSEPWEMLDNLYHWLDNDGAPWIVNIDLDYFFCSKGETAQLMFSDSYIKSCFSQIKEKIDEGVVGVTTICLTPDDEFTGGWTPSEQLAEKVLGYLGIEFNLPNT